jgi:heme exporter protein A
MLECVKAAKLYGRKLVFKGVSFSLAPGEVMLLAGPNGAGKSTLLRIVAGLERPTAGSVSCTAEPGAIGYIGHATFLYPQLSALENLAFWSRYSGKRTTEATLIRTLERMNLAHAAHERAGSFSRGMAQRLSLARVFILEPRLVLLDEPGTGLDVQSRALLAREIAGLKKSDAAVLWVSHHLEHDLDLADKVLTIENNRMAFCGPTESYRTLCIANAPRDVCIAQ